MRITTLDKGFCSGVLKVFFYVQYIFSIGLLVY